MTQPCSSVVVLLVVGCGGGGGAPGVDAAPGHDASPDAASNAALLRVHYDAGLGRRITLRGDGPGLTWMAGVDCTPTGAGVWECPVRDVLQSFEVKPLVDDTTWARGTNYRLSPGATVDVYPNFFGTTGRLVTHRSISSAFLTARRDVVVYLPPSYDENAAKRYPLVFMHDGQNLFDPAQAFGGVAWEIDAAMDDLVGTAGIHEAIVVGVANTADRIDEYTPTVDPQYGGGQASSYVRFLVEELAPFIRATYRTDGGRAGIAGSSLGGLVSLYGCWTRPDAFDRCGVFSPSLWWDNKNLLGAIAADAATAATKPLRIYLDSGDSGTNMDGKANVLEMRDILVGKGFVPGATLQHVVGVGHAHNERAWAARSPGALRFLLQDPARVP